MQQAIKVVQIEMGEIGKKVDKLLMYVVGDENTSEISMLARIRDLEEDLIDMKKEYQNLKDKRNSDSIYIKIMWGLIGAVAMSVIGFLFFLVKSKM